MCADSYSVSVPPRVTAVARKKTRSFCQKCWWQVIPKHPDIHNPRRWSGLTIPLSRHSVRIYPETSLHATCQGTFGHSRLSSLSHCGLILAYKSGKSVRELISTLKKQKRRRGMNCQTFSQNPCTRGKSHYPHTINQHWPQYGKQ